MLPPLDIAMLRGLEQQEESDRAAHDNEQEELEKELASAPKPKWPEVCSCPHIRLTAPRSLDAASAAGVKRADSWCSGQARPSCGRFECVRPRVCVVFVRLDAPHHLLMLG